MQFVYATQGWEDVAHLKDELLTQQRKVDKLQTELADLEKAENSLKVWGLEDRFSAMES